MGRGGARRRLVGPTIAAFALVIVLVAALFVVLVHAIGDVRDDASRARETERVVSLTSRLNRLTIDLETGVRGRLLTGDDRFLEPFRAADAAIPETIAALRELVTEPARRRQLAALVRRVQGSRTGYARDLARAPAGEPRARVASVAADGKRRLDDLRRRFDAFRTAELASSDDRSASVRSAADRATAVAVARLAVSVLLVGLLAPFTLRRIRP